MNKHMNFLDENEMDTQTAAQARVAILSAPLANTVSWGKGTELGPQAIIEASKALETIDDELLVETYRVGIETLPPLDFTGLAMDGASRIIKEAVKKELDKKRLPVILGGEQSVTVPAVEACLERFGSLHVLQFDAHLDLRLEYSGSPFSHACVMRRLHELGVTFTQVGIRSFSREEYQFVRDNNLKPYSPGWIRNHPDWLEQIAAGVRGPLYITFDVDGLDPAIMPATGTPEPDGLSWQQATSLLRRVCRENQVVGMDFVELAPNEGLHHASFTAAKLVYRTLGYVFENVLEKV